MKPWRRNWIRPEALRRTLSFSGAIGFALILLCAYLADSEAVKIGPMLSLPSFRDGEYLHLTVRVVELLRAATLVVLSFSIYTESMRIGRFTVRLLRELLVLIFYVLVIFTPGNDDLVANLPVILALSLGILGSRLFVKPASSIVGSPRYFAALGWISVSVLVLGSFAATNSYSIFEYRTVLRFAGGFSDPNLSGMLAAVGLVLTIGLSVPMVRRSANCSRMASCFVAVASLLLVSRFLFVLHGSYSRGAWLAAFIGGLAIVLRVGNVVRVELSEERRSQFWRLGISLFMLLPLLAFLRDTEAPTLRRVLSVSNAMDMSWLNRVNAWIDTCKLIVDYPLRGCGWQNVGPMIEQFYQSYHLPEVAAVFTNSYLHLGAASGLPSLGCFILVQFIAISSNGTILTAVPSERNARGLCRAYTRISSEAAVIVILVGSSFNGAMFTLTAALLLWVFAEIAFSLREVHENQIACVKT